MNWIDTILGLTGDQWIVVGLMGPARRAQIRGAVRADGRAVEEAQARLSTDAQARDGTDEPDAPGPARCVDGGLHALGCDRQRRGGDDGAEGQGRALHARVAGDSDVG